MLSPKFAESYVTDYRAHIVMGNALNDKVIALDCVDDAGALEAAERFVDGHDVEVWCDFCKLGTLHYYMRAEPAKGASSIKVGVPADRRAGNLSKRRK
jgi:hypothetical protein